MQDIEQLQAAELNLERIQKTIQIMLEDYYIQPSNNYDKENIDKKADNYEKIYIHLENLLQLITDVRADIIAANIE